MGLYVLHAVLPSWLVIMDSYLLVNIWNYAIWVMRWVIWALGFFRILSLWDVTTTWGYKLKASVQLNSYIEISLWISAQSLPLNYVLGSNSTDTTYCLERLLRSLCFHFWRFVSVKALWALLHICTISLCIMHDYWSKSLASQQTIQFNQLSSVAQFLNADFACGLCIFVERVSVWHFLRRFRVKAIQCHAESWGAAQRGLSVSHF